MKQKTISIGVVGEPYRKWDIIRIAGSNQLGIIIGIDLDNKLGAEYSIYPYTTPKNKFLRRLKFQWLKLRVWLKIIK